MLMNFIHATTVSGINEILARVDTFSHLIKVLHARLQNFGLTIWFRYAI